MNKAVLGVITLLLLGALGIYYLVNQPDSSIDTPTPTSTLEPTSQPLATAEPTESTSEEENALRAGGSSYLDPQGVFTILYPSDYIVDSPAENHVRIFTRAETARPQSEISDGAMVVIESVSLDGKTLEQYVDEKIKTSTEDGTSELVEPKSSTTVNGYPAFTYTVRGLGTFPQIVMQKDANSDFAVIFTTLVEDPRSVGYQKEVDAIIATLELLK